MTHIEVISTMGTQVSVDVRTRRSAGSIGETMELVADRLEAIDEVFSPWRPDSWVSRVISGQVSPADCPPEVQHVLELSMSLSDATDGYFSPFWRRAAYGDPGPDPTGLVKGWAAQQASDILIARELPDHIVNAAGDMVVSGQAAPGDFSSTWRIGVSDPHHARALAGVIEIDQSARRWSVATSGKAELGAHVVDPRTGRPSGSVASATVITRLDSVDDGAAVADACATALVASGPSAHALVDRFKKRGLDSILIGEDGRVHDPGERLSRVRASF